LVPVRPVDEETLKVDVAAKSAWMLDDAAESAVVEAVMMVAVPPV
jgi:hypothetical protein